MTDRSKPAVHWRLLRSLLLSGLLLTLFPVSAEAQSQERGEQRVSRHELAEFYRTARLQLQLEKILREQGHTIRLIPPAALPLPYDTVLTWLAQFYPRETTEAPPPLFEMRNWKLVDRGDRRNWARHFGQRDDWSYLGANGYTMLDTTRTRELRARMQAHFGDPTRTLAEQTFSRNLGLEEYIQFEYWFVVNDTIPVRVMDSNGPSDRGVVVATDPGFRDALPIIRETLLAPVSASPARSPYVDYYFARYQGRWYEAGFDGRRFFMHSIPTPNLNYGRPRLPGPDSG